jgi:hypothetical protein
MMAARNPMPTPATILGEHGPLHEDHIARQLRDSDVADPDTVLEDGLDETPR